VWWQDSLTEAESKDQVTDQSSMTESVVAVTDDADSSLPAAAAAAAAVNELDSQVNTPVLYRLHPRNLVSNC